MKKCDTQKAGFTLVEVLVVLALVAVLAAMLLGVLSRLREKGRSAVCQSNLKQIALGIRQYVQDNDGHFPDDGWHIRIADYIRDERIVQCPTRNAVPVNPLDDKDPLAEPDYGYNRTQLCLYRLMPGGYLRTAGQAESAVIDAAATWMNADNMVADELGLGTSSCGTPTTMSALHNGGANYSFADGHVKWLNPTTRAALECH